MTDIVSLLPCPFCGSDSLQVIETEYCGDSFCPTVTIDCRNCPAGMYLVGGDMAAVMEEIIIKWNTRT